MFKIKFKTWENDGDDYRDKSIFVTKKEDVEFYEALGKMFSSCNRMGDGQGNQDVENDILAEMICDLILEHNEISESVRELWSDEESVYDNLCKYVLDSPVQYDYGFCRVVESVHVVEAKLGALITLKSDDIGVFINVNNDIVNYRFGQHPLVNGEIDIYKMEWVQKTCPIKDVEDIKDSTKTSLMVANI